MSKAYKDYTIDDVSRLNGGFLNKSPEQMEAFKLLSSLLMAVNFPELRAKSLLATFPHPTKVNRMMELPADINGRFVELYNATLVDRATQGYGLNALEVFKPDIVGITQIDYEREIREKCKSIELNRTELDRLLSRVTSRISRVVELKSNLESLKKIRDLGSNDESIYNNVTAILSNPFWQFIEYDKYNYRLSFATTRSVYQKHVNVAAGINQECDLGYMMVEINVKTLAVHVRPFFGNLESEETNLHPNISDSANVCWGTSAIDHSKAVESKDMKTIMDILANLLLNYSNGTPYISLGDYIARAKVTDRYIEDSNIPFYITTSKEHRTISETYLRVRDTLPVAVDTSIIKQTGIIAKEPDEVTTNKEQFREYEGHLLIHCTEEWQLAFKPKNSDIARSVVDGKINSRTIVKWLPLSFELFMEYAECMINNSQHTLDITSIQEMLNLENKPESIYFGAYSPLYRAGKTGELIMIGYSKNIDYYKYHEKADLTKYSIKACDRKYIIPIFKGTDDEVYAQITKYINWCNDTQAWEYDLDTIKEFYPYYIDRRNYEEIANNIKAFEDKFTCTGCSATNGDVIPTYAVSGSTIVCHACTSTYTVSQESITNAVMEFRDEE